MVKTVLKYFLSLIIFLLYGHGLLHAHTGRECIHYSSTEILDCIALSSQDTVQDDQALIEIPSSSNSKHDDLKFKASVIELEEEDESSESFKKYTDNVSYATFLHASLIPVFFYQDLKKGLISKKYYPYSTNKWYLRLEVFRL